MPTHAVIDVGSNTVVLCTYDVRPTVLGHDVTCTSMESNPVHLASYVSGGRMSDDGIAAASLAINTFVKKAIQSGCSNLGIFATAALRNCDNSKQAVQKIQELTGQVIDVISGETEAHLGFVGAASESRIGRGLIIDIGGGSTEVTVVSDGRDSRSASLPLGALSTANHFVAGDFPTSSEAAAIRTALRRRLKALDSAYASASRQLYGASGTIRSALRLIQSNEPTLMRPDLERIVSMASTHPDVLMEQLERYTPQRKRMMVPGCLLMLEIMDWARCDSIRVCQQGVREGYLLERML